MVTVEEAPVKRNVWLIWIDSLSWDVFSNLASRGDLPNITELAQSGTLFSQAISSSTTTSPCTGSLLTGLYPFEHGIRTLRGYQLGGDTPTLAETLQREGYRTVAMVSGPLDPMIGLDRGFDQYDLRSADENLYDESLTTAIQEVITDRGEQPWFFFLHLWDSHAPYWIPDLGGEQRKRDRIQPKKRYEEALFHLDKNLGNLLRQVDFSDTIVVLLADHGEIVGSLKDRVNHKLNTRRGINPVDSRYVHLGHGSTITDKLVRVPLIIRADGLISADTVNGMVRQVDIAPTISELCGVSWPHSTQGRALFDRQGNFNPPADFVLMEAVGRARTSSRDWMVGGRTGQWKYVVAPLMPDSLTALYNLDNDPTETRNVVRDYPAVAREIKAEIETIFGSSIEDLKWPKPSLEKSDIRLLEGRLHDLGYL